MTEEMKNVNANGSCECGDDGTCSHNDSSDGVMQMLTKHRGNDEVALAFLLALTPLAVLTFFGQIGLI